MSKYWELKHKQGNGYWYENENGNKSKLFQFAYPYSGGFGMVKLNNGKYAYLLYHNTIAYSNFLLYYQFMVNFTTKKRKPYLTIGFI